MPKKKQMVFFNNVEQDFSQIDIDSIGSQETYNHYPVGTICVHASLRSLVD